MTFDTIAGSGAGTYDARSTITVTCTGSQGANIAACVDLGQARAPADQRGFSGPKGKTMQIQIFQDATLTRPWGTAAMGPGSHAAAHRRRPDVGDRLCPPLHPKGGDLPGTYRAQLPVTLRYGAVIGNFADCNALGSVAVWPAAPKPAAIPAVPRKR